MALIQVFLVVVVMEMVTVTVMAMVTGLAPVVPLKIRARSTTKASKNLIPVLSPLKLLSRTISIL
ncbi:hypothetical protein D3C75_1326680 [compost metagenome]